MELIKKLGRHLLWHFPMPAGWRFRLHRRVLDRGYAKAVTTAKRDRKDLEEVWNEWQIDFAMLEDDEARHHSRQLLRRLEQLRLPRPAAFDGLKLTPEFQRSGFDSEYYLTLLGEQKVRAAIHEEEKRRAEKWARRIPYVSALTGLVGAATGLVVALDKFSL